MAGMATGGMAAALAFTLQAQTWNLEPLPAEAIPKFGNFYSLQRSNSPPLPFNPFPAAPVYALDNFSFLIDDSEVDYEAMYAQDAARRALAGSLAGGYSPLAMSAADYGCDLWLKTTAGTNAVVLTLHNTYPGRAYQILRNDDLATTNWTILTNVFGTVGDDKTVVGVPTTNAVAFFRAVEAAAYVVEHEFAGLGFQDTDAGTPDTMGAVGPGHFVELLNGLIAVFDKTNGTLLEVTNTKAFFFVNSNCPSGNPTLDSRLVYDAQSDRWVAFSMDIGGTREAILAVSRNANPALTNWDKYLIPVRREGLSSNYGTLGYDANGIYISVFHAGLYPATNAGNTIVAIKKSDVYTGKTNPVIRMEYLNDTNFHTWCIQPAVNFDAVTPDGYAWFVAKGSPEWGTNYRGGAVYYRRLQWNTNDDTTTWAEPWTEVTDPDGTYRNYYDFDGTNVITNPAGGLAAPQLDGPPVALWVVGSRLMMATIRNGFLWTCHHVGLSGEDGTYVGDITGDEVTRSGVQWLRVGVGFAGQSPTNVTHGRLFDACPSDPYWYYYPSLAVNSRGDMVGGFSASRQHSYIGAYYGWWATNGSSSDRPLVIHAGEAPYQSPEYDDGSTRWGDYSFTTSDPAEPGSIWTVQQYAEPPIPEENPSWRTRIAKIIPRE